MRSPAQSSRYEFPDLPAVNGVPREARVHVRNQVEPDHGRGIERIRDVLRQGEDFGNLRDGVFIEYRGGS